MTHIIVTLRGSRVVSSSVLTQEMYNRAIIGCPFSIFFRILLKRHMLLTDTKLLKGIDVGHKSKTEKRPPIISGFVYIGLGLFLLWADVGTLEDTWPVLIIVIGIALIAGAMFKGKRKAGVNDSPPPPPSPTETINP